jgi:3-dehydrosphinganine reductase
MKDFQDKVVVITGGSSGIGLACGKLLSQTGANVFIVARCVSESCSAALEQIQKVSRSQDQVHGVIVADVTQEDQIRDEIAKLSAELGVPDLLINSAGITRPGYFMEIDSRIFHDLMDVNYFGIVNTIRAVLPGMFERGSGYIVNVASMASVIGMICYSAYGASKFAVRGLSDVLRAELRPRGIQVSIVFPPDTDTPQLAGEAQYKPPELIAIVGEHSKVMSPEAVASEILRGIQRNRYIILPGSDAKLYYFLTNLLGTKTYPVFDRFYLDPARRKAARRAK